MKSRGFFSVHDVSAWPSMVCSGPEAPSIFTIAEINRRHSRQLQQRTLRYRAHSFGHNPGSAYLDLLQWHAVNLSNPDPGRISPSSSGPLPGLFTDLVDDLLLVSVFQDFDKVHLSGYTSKCHAHALAQSWKGGLMILPIPLRLPKPSWTMLPPPATMSRTSSAVGFIASTAFSRRRFTSFLAFATTSGDTISLATIDASPISISGSPAITTSVVFKVFPPTTRPSCVSR